VTQIEQKIARLRETAARKVAEAKISKNAAASERQVQLPVWPDPVRAVPNGFLRSALFGAIRKGVRRYMDREKVASVDGLEILYTGQRLDQGDLDAYESVLHTVRLQALGEQCRVTSYALLKLMGKTDSGSNRETLHKRLTRLRANAIEMKQGRYSYIGGLLAAAFKDEETQEWVIELDPRLHALFAPDQFTQIEWIVRHALSGKPLAQWLHGFYASHAKPFPVKVETLHRLCGSEAARMDHYRQDLRRSLDAVAEASVTHGEGFSYEIRNDLVYVEKKASRSQRRHLANKAKKP
jgi:hypothetical protein